MGVQKFKFGSSSITFDDTERQKKEAEAKQKQEQLKSYVKSSLGYGQEDVVTGYGSKLWQPGLDVVVKGGKGAPVQTPFAGEVIFVGNVKGFGNQVKIRTNQGKEIWLSHLDGFDVKTGDKVGKGSVIGRQGNTGSVYSTSGGDGTHVDITMKKPGGGFYTAKEVDELRKKGESMFINLNERVDEARKKGKSDTEILDSLAEKVPQLGDAIGKIRSRYSIDKNITNDRDLINKLSEKYSGKKPTVTSTPIITTNAEKKASFDEFKTYYDRRLQGKFGNTSEAYEKYSKDFDNKKRTEWLGEAYKKFNETPVGKTVDFIGNIPGYIGKAVDYTGLPYVIGAATAPLGVVGGAIGTAVGHAGKALYEMRYGQAPKSTWEEVKNDIINSSLETGKFAYETGKTGTETAPLFGAGKYVDAVLSLPALKSSFDKYSKGDSIGAAADALVGSLAFVGSTKTRGKFIDPDFKAGLGKVVNNARAKAGSKLTPALTDRMEKVADDYIRKTPSMTRLEEKWNKNTSKFLVDEGVMNLLKIDENKVDTTKIKEELTQRYKNEAEYYDLVLKDSGKYASLDDLAKNAKSQIDETFKSKGTEYKKANKYIDDEVEALKENYADVIVDGDKLPIDIFNGVKSSFWQRSSVNKLTRESIFNDLDFIIGHEAKNIIEKTVDDAGIAQMNSRLGDFANAIRTLEMANGRVIPGGKMGNYFTGIMGTITGGMVGGVPGAIAGRFTAIGLAKTLATANREFTYRLLNQLNKNKEGRTIAEQALDIINKRGLDKLQKNLENVENAYSGKAPKALPEPKQKIIYGKEKTDTSGIIKPTEPTNAEIEAARKSVGIKDYKVKELPAPSGSSRNPFIVNKKGKTSTKMGTPLYSASAGLISGIRTDEDGNVYIDPRYAMMGVAGFLSGKKLIDLTPADFSRLRNLDVDEFGNYLTNKETNILAKAASLFDDFSEKNISKAEFEEKISKLDESWSNAMSENRGINNIKAVTPDEALIQDAKGKTLDEFIGEQIKKDYRSTHQIRESVSVDKIDIELLKQQIKEKKGWINNYDLLDLKRLKKLIGNPDKEITIYRASSKNELNPGDWITNDKVYANDIKRQNGGKVYSYTVKVGDLRFPTDIDSLPSSSMAAAFQYNPKYKQLQDIWNKANKEKGYKDTGALSLKTLSKLEGNTEIPKNEIVGIMNKGGIKQQEKDLINSYLEKHQGNKVNVEEMAKSLKAELLPLQRLQSGKIDEAGRKFRERHENISLTKELRGNVVEYRENIYESPIKTSAGNIHFGSDSERYFGHTRTEDLAITGKNGIPLVGDYEKLLERGFDPNPPTRRVIEVQSDLYQKGRLERELQDTGWIIKNQSEIAKELGVKNSREEVLNAIDNLSDKESEILYNKYAIEVPRKNVEKLSQYSNPTAHFRMVREEVKKAAEDGMKKLQFPTGETAMKIEGLGDTTQWTYKDEGLYSHAVQVGDLEVGMTVNQNAGGFVAEHGLGNRGDWIITDVLGDGKFRAVPKRIWDSYKDPSIQNLGGEVDEKYLEDSKESFDISGKVDTENPIYKFYEKDLGRYLSKEYGAKLVTDDKGVKWYEVDVKQDMKDKPVSAFGFTTPEAMFKMSAGMLAVIGVTAIGNKYYNRTKNNDNKEQGYEEIVIKDGKITSNRMITEEEYNKISRTKNNNGEDDVLKNETNKEYLGINKEKIKETIAFAEGFGGDEEKMIDYLKKNNPERLKQQGKNKYGDAGKYGWVVGFTVGTMDDIEKRAKNGDKRYIKLLSKLNFDTQENAKNSAMHYFIHKNTVHDKNGNPSGLKEENLEDAYVNQYNASNDREQARKNWRTHFKQ